MHFASFFPLMESVEHEFLRHLGLSVLANDGTGPVSWPRVNAQCDFRAAVRFEDELAVELRIARLGEKSVTYQFDIRHGEELVAEGRNHRRLLSTLDHRRADDAHSHSASHCREVSAVCEVAMSLDRRFIARLSEREGDCRIAKIRSQNTISSTMIAPLHPARE